ncbi:MULTISPECIES: hypothetical protein [unclassified Azospirillum]|uniref:hypothetical protein n=1 Tax=unclassified Azospirillum TaxID=2630922 RepID=UPI0011B226CB|nr:MULTISPECIES: hypothetical protein [unclassified Azospirillum]
MSGQEEVDFWTSAANWTLSWGGFFLTLGGFVISVWTVVLATSVKKMVRIIISRSNAQEDGDRLKAVIAQLNEAKEIAIRRKTGPSSINNAGTKNQRDIQKIVEAHDALLTRFPIECDQKLRDDAAKAATDLGNSIQDINGNNMAGWNSALATLQTLIPQLDQAERKNRNQLVLPLGE